MRITKGALHRALGIPEGVALQQDIEAMKQRLAALQKVERETREDLTAVTNAKPGETVTIRTKVTKKNRFTDWETWQSISSLIQ